MQESVFARAIGAHMRPEALAGQMGYRDPAALWRHLDGASVAVEVEAVGADGAGQLDSHAVAAVVAAAVVEGEVQAEETRDGRERVTIRHEEWRGRHGLRVTVAVEARRRGYPLPRGAAEAAAYLVYAVSAFGGGSHPLFYDAARELERRGRWRRRLRPDHLAALTA